METDVNQMLKQLKKKVSEAPLTQSKHVRGTFFLDRELEEPPLPNGQFIMDPTSDVTNPKPKTKLLWRVQRRNAVDEPIATEELKSAEPKKEAVKPEEPKQAESKPADTVPIKPPNHLAYLAINTCVLILLSVLLFNHYQVTDQKTSQGPLTLAEVVSVLKEKGHEIVAGKILGANQTYSGDPIVVNRIFKIVGSQDFMYSDNYGTANEVLVKGGEIVEGKTDILPNRPFVFTVRALANNTKIVLLYKTSNGIDPIKGLTKTLDSLFGPIGSLIAWLFWFAIKILAIASLILEAVLIYKAGNDETSKPRNQYGRLLKP